MGEPHDPDERKVIRATLGLPELAKQPGNVTQACRVLGYTARASTAC
jgi:hypothetical protein